MAWERDLLEEVRAAAEPLAAERGLDPVLERCSRARVVLVGEASHGTSEHYRWRGELTRRLVEEEGFSLVAVEGDWPSCMEVTRWLKDPSDEREAEEVLSSFQRWPRWMWANEEVASFLRWLKEVNRGRPYDERVGFYGLDVYSLWESLGRLLEHVEAHHPESAPEVKEALSCFEPYGEDPQMYAWATRLLPLTCEHEVAEVLYSIVGGESEGAEEHLDAEMNAHALKGAEAYYRTMVEAGPESWNVRDTHMTDTIGRLLAHHGEGAKVVVWEHNTHVGDARATDMALAGMVNVGQLARERWDGDVAVVGMTIHRGEVVAGEEWGSPAERMEVPPAPEGTLEDLLHEALHAPSALVLDPEALWSRRALPHRAIGVVYDPRRDAWSNYVPTVPSARYDCLLHFEETSGIAPLGPEEPLPEEELAETYPSGM